MRRALCAAIVAAAAFGGTAAMSAPAFAADHPDGPLVISTGQPVPVLDCAKPVDGLEGEGWQVIPASTDPGACRLPKKVACLAGPTKNRDGGKWHVRIRDEHGEMRKLNIRDEEGVPHKLSFRHKGDAERFAVKNKHAIRVVGCSAER
ncbi:hypothetical protein ABZ297_00470 [Nonomuraea sp. NPDC005983]|uniref:hypothetical protein n=1 Tax=Nonomuraea sp. NPDC005983 TaxID=3155595 RepID=UPI0033BDA884